VVLAGHRADIDTALELWDDEDPVVRAGAIGALDRLGALVPEKLAEALADTEPVVRRRAAAVAGQIGARPSPGRAAGVLVGALTDTLGDSVAAVAEMAAWALGEWEHNCDGRTVAQLSIMAREHRDALCREAAVAALGAISDEGGLEAILEALDDKPAIRRRAAIALAAFDDPRVETALRRCLEDRDWQVRQAAQELLSDMGTESS